MGKVGKEGRNLKRGQLRTISQDLASAFSEKAREYHLKKTRKPYILFKREAKDTKNIREVYVFTWFGMTHKILVRNTCSGYIQCSDKKSHKADFAKRLGSILTSHFCLFCNWLIVRKDIA